MSDRFDEDDVARLRVALARISRQLDRQTRGSSQGRAGRAPAATAAPTRAESSLLGTLARCGPQRVTELAEIEGVHPTMLSRMVGKLEDAALVRKAADPADGRAWLVGLTPAGDALHQRLRAERTRLLTGHLATLPEHEADQLVAALPALESLAKALSAPPEHRR